MKDAKNFNGVGCFGQFSQNFRAAATRICHMAAFKTIICELKRVEMYGVSFTHLAAWREIITLVPPKAELYVAQIRQAAKQKTHRVIYVAFACCHAKGS